MSMKLLPSGIAVIEGDTHISKWVEETGRLDHDAVVRDMIVPLIKPGDIVVDVGAYIGDHTVAYAEATGHRGHVYAYEINPDALECLRHNTQHLDNVEVRDRALSNTTLGRYRFVSDSNAGACHLVPDSAGPILATRLDDDLLGRRVDFMKLDVEGMEWHVLNGASYILETYHPTLWFEINRGALARHNRTPEDLFHMLRLHYGYARLLRMTGHNIDDEQFEMIATSPTTTTKNWMPPK